MLTKLNIFKKSRDLKNNLCSKFNVFPKVLSPFSKMDIYKCPKTI